MKKTLQMISDGLIRIGEFIGRIADAIGISDLLQRLKSERVQGDEEDTDGIDEDGVA